MSDHLYLLNCDMGGEEFMAPCIGDSELSANMEIITRLGCRVVSIKDVDGELAYLVRSCHLEGIVKGWWLGA